MTKQQAGKLGGLATVARYGKEYMAMIGARGARTLWERYQLVPYQLSKYALVSRETGKIIAIH